MLNIGPEKFLVLFAVALVVLGPEELPRVARQAGRVFATLRDARARLEADVLRFTESLGAEPDGVNHRAAGPTGPHDDGAPVSPTG